MTIQPSVTNQFDAARLARQNWQQDGCPPGRESEYYQMAQAQIEALRNLLAYDRKAFTSANRVSLDPDKEVRTEKI